MQPDFPMMAQGQTASTTRALAQNRVLRNTYALLALSLVPTIAGAWAGIQMNFARLFAGHPAISFIAFLAIAFGFFYGIEKTKNSGLGVALLLAFTFFMGVWLAPMLGMILGLANGWKLIALAFGGTAVVFATMASVAIDTKITAVPPKASAMRLAPFARPSTAPSMRDSMRPMKNVKPRSSTTPMPLFLVFSMP